MTKTILVVEDDPTNQQVLADYLTSQGYRVVVAPDGNEGVRMFHTAKPDLMIVDALLPYKNGFEVCFEVRRSPEGRNTPLLMMSAVCKDAHSTHHATLALHANGYFIKPFKVRDLLKTVNSLIGTA